MSTLSLNGSVLGNNLQTLLMADDIQPGDEVSYQTCKTIYVAHPLGAKMADSPIAMAQSQEREISIPKGPEDRLKEAYQREWRAIGADRHIFNLARLARVYGVASIALLVDGVPSNRAIDYNQLHDAKIGFNVLDPLNTAGSLVLDQNPNSITFQKTAGISVQGQAYHRSRTVTLLNEEPIYINYTVSAFGYVGRSVYQRALYPLKSFIQTMITDDMVSRKAGVLVAMMKTVSSAVDRIMSNIAGMKRALLKEAQTDNIISIGSDEKVESIDLKNVNQAMETSRKDILENIATAADMPAKLLNAETFAEGFGEGSEDAKHVAQYVDRMRIWMGPAYDYFDKIVMYRAWNREFYKTIQTDFPDYQEVGYTKAFYDWRNSFTAAWPNLLREPDSERIKVDDVRLKAIIAMLEVLIPELDPENKATTIQWAAQNFNQLKLLFGDPLILDYDALREYEPPQIDALQEQKPPPAFSARDSAERRSGAVLALTEAVGRLPDRAASRERRLAPLRSG